MIDNLNSDTLNARQYFAMMNHFDNEAFEKCMCFKFSIK